MTPHQMELCQLLRKAEKIENFPPDGLLDKQKALWENKFYNQKCFSSWVAFPFNFETLDR